MNFSKIWQEKKNTISFEFYPGHNEKSILRLEKIIAELLPLQADFVSVTFGAGGSSRQGSLELLKYLVNNAKTKVVGYLAAYGLSSEELSEIALRYHQLGVDALFCIRGDIPKEEPIPPHPQGFQYATDLVKHLKTRMALPIGVAAYPEGHIEASSEQTDWDHLIYKTKQGAEFIISQYFYDNQFFYNFQEYLRQRGVALPILAGIMPIYNPKLTRSLAEKCGALLPPPVLAALDQMDPEDKEKLNAFGVDLSLKQCRDLLKYGVNGLHFYTMDRSQSVSAIVGTLQKEGLI